MDLTRLRKTGIRKTGIILLAILLLATFACTCESTKSDDKGRIFEEENTSGRLLIEKINQENQCLSLISTVESKFNYVLNLNSRFIPPAANGNKNMPQDFNPRVERGRPRQFSPEFTREVPAKRGIPDRRFDSFLERQNLQQKNGSYYQSYVTPDTHEVTSYLEENDLENKHEIYEASLSWTWVSDETLNGVEEKWITPAEFLEKTQDYSSNPDYGNPVSDCEEQANTLASLLIASGEYNESTVRVAIGEVNFGNTSGGHAWVEVYEDGEWFQLDPTDGPYYDDDSCELVSADILRVSYDKYLSSTYPAVEVWYYYNNKYFMDTGTQKGNAPVSWSKIPANYQRN